MGPRDPDKLNTRLTAIATELNDTKKQNKY